MFIPLDAALATWLFAAHFLKSIDLQVLSLAKPSPEKGQNVLRMPVSLVDLPCLLSRNNQNCWTHALFIIRKFMNQFWCQNGPKMFPGFLQRLPSLLYRLPCRDCLWTLWWRGEKILLNLQKKIFLVERSLGSPYKPRTAQAWNVGYRNESPFHCVRFLSAVGRA